MKIPKKLEKAFRKIGQINYNNEHGGAYAYLQFMAYTREILVMLRPVKKAERQMEAIEAMNWLFNEYLSVKFSYSHKVIFDEKLSEIKKIFESMEAIFEEKEIRRAYDGKLYHAQAA